MPVPDSNTTVSPIRPVDTGEAIVMRSKTNEAERNLRLVPYECVVIGLAAGEGGIPIDGRDGELAWPDQLRQSLPKGSQELSGRTTIA